jgi:dienelactone hydrolase
MLEFFARLLSFPAYLAGGDFMFRRHCLLLIALFFPSLTTAQTANPAPGNAAPAKAVAPLSTESFAAPPFIEYPELSPNGTWFASKVVVNGNQLLAMMPLAKTGEKPVFTRLDPEQSEVNWWRWINDDWLLVGFSATIPVLGEKWRVYRTASVSRLTGKIIPLAPKSGGQNAANVIWSAKDGRPHILLGVQDNIFTGERDFWPEVRDIDVSTGKSQTIVAPRPDVMEYYADASGAVRLGYGYNRSSRTARLIYRSTGKGTFSQLDTANYRKDEKLSFPAMFLPAPDQALTVSDSDGFDALYELDLRTMARGKRIFGVPGHDIDGFVRNPAGDAVLGVIVTENRARVHWLDPALAEAQAEIDKAVGVGNALITSWDRAMGRLLIRVGGPDQAGAYYAYDRLVGGKMVRLAYADENLKTRKLSPVSTIRFKARDGLEMSAVLTLPKDKEAKNLPLIVLPHGGPQARDSERWDWWVQFLAWRGYVVIQPNYRGSTGFGTELVEKGYGEWGLKMQDDLNDAVAHLAKSGMIDPKRVCIAGASYGGYAAMRAAQRDGSLFRCAISYAGVSDLGALARYDSQSLLGAEYRASLKEKAPDFDAVSPLRHPEQFSTPILIMHGKLDLRVPVKQSRDMAEKLKSAGKPYRYVEQPLGDHHFSRTEDRLQFLKEMEAFLAQYNPA